MGAAATARPTPADVPLMLPTVAPIKPPTTCDALISSFEAMPTRPRKMREQPTRLQLLGDFAAPVRAAETAKAICLVVDPVSFEFNWDDAAAGVKLPL